MQYYFPSAAQDAQDITEWMQAEARTLSEELQACASELQEAIELHSQALVTYDNGCLRYLRRQAEQLQAAAQLSEDSSKEAQRAALRKLEFAMQEIELAIGGFFASAAARRFLPYSVVLEAKCALLSQQEQLRSLASSLALQAV